MECDDVVGIADVSIHVDLEHYADSRVDNKTESGFGGGVSPKGRLS